MRGATGFESGLRQAARVARGAGAFQAMHQNQVRDGFGCRRLRMHQNPDAGLGVIELGLDRETPLVQLATPVVTGYRKQVRIAQKRDKGMQRIILRATGRRSPKSQSRDLAAIERNPSDRQFEPVERRCAYPLPR